MGLEKTPEEYVSKLVDIFREVWRVLRDDGTLFLNLGDTYGAYYGDKYGQPNSFGKKRSENIGQTTPTKKSPDFKKSSFKPKDLVGIPWMVAFALRADGWYLRSDIIWHKPNPMPESVTDRPTKSHEYIFLLSKSQRYFYDADAIREPDSGQQHRRNVVTGAPSLEPSGGLKTAHGSKLWGTTKMNGSGRNKRSVWTVATKPFKGAHFATFPPALIEPCILAGTSEKGCCVECGAPWVRVVEKVEGENQEWAQDVNPSAKESALIQTGKRCSHGKLNRGSKEDYYQNRSVSKTTGWKPTCKCNAKTKPCTVLDPFGGAMTSAVVAYKHDRKFIMSELSETYIKDIGIPRIERETKQLKLF